MKESTNKEFLIFDGVGIRDRNEELVEFMKEGEMSSVKSKGSFISRFISWIKKKRPKTHYS